MGEPMVLTFDVGTQSVKALLIDKTGNIAAQAQRYYETPYYSLQPNWAEQDPELYYRELCEASRALKEAAPEAFDAAECVAVTVFRDSFICLDKAGKPLRDCILWMDQRKVKKPKPVPPVRQALFAAVGMWESAQMLNRTCMCNWIVENEPEIWEQTDKFVLLSTYLNLRMTGRLVDSWASQIGHIPFDYKNRCWDENGLTRCLYDIPTEKLCDIVPAGSQIGGITPECALRSGMRVGLILIATGSDKGCETLGLGVIQPDQAALSFGTSCTVHLTSKKYFEPMPYVPAFPAVPNDLYNGEVQLWRGYWMLTWFKENFAQKEVEEAAFLGCSVYDLLNARLKDVPPGCEGLMVLPHWTPGLATPGARGAMVGFSDVHTRHHIYRAIIEGLNFGLMEGMYGMEKRSGQRVKHLFVAGGGSRSDEICQITANMFGLPVHRIQTSEACSLGAAMCAFVSRGEFRNYREAIASMVHVWDTFRPDMAEHEIYKELYGQVYGHLYRRLVPLHKRLAALTRGIRRKETENVQTVETL